MQKSLFKLSFIGLLFLTTINTTTPSNPIEKINIIDQTSEQNDLPSANDAPFFDFSINEIWKTKLKPVLQDKKFIVKLLVLFGSVFLMDNTIEIAGIAQKMQYDNNMWNRINLCNSLMNKAFFTLVPLVCCTGWACVDFAFYIVKKIAKQKR